MPLAWVCEYLKRMTKRFEYEFPMSRSWENILHIHILQLMWASADWLTVNMPYFTSAQIISATQFHIPVIIWFYLKLTTFKSTRRQLFLKTNLNNDFLFPVGIFWPHFLLWELTLTFRKDLHMNIKKQWLNPYIRTSASSDSREYGYYRL